MARPSTKVQDTDEDEKSTTITAKQRYDALTTYRDQYVKRAIESATFTIPALMPPLGHNGSTPLYQPFQSVGAEGVNNLAAKLLLALFPPGGAFFRLTLDDFVLQELAKKYTDPAQLEDARTQFEAALSKIERAVMNRMEQTGCRMALFECFKQLIVAGNALLQVKPDGSFKLHRLTHYVVKRDLAGNVLEIVVKESIAKSALPPQLLAVLSSSHTKDEEANEEDKEGVGVYTHICRESGKWIVYQEVRGKRVPKSDGTYPLDKCPWIPLRFIAVDGEDYGRGFVEEQIGALTSLDSLNQSIIEGSAMAAKVLFLTNESGVTDKNKLAKARNGAFVNGDIRDVNALKLDKNADFAVAQATAAEFKRDLQRAFLLLVGSQRNAERVTAEEIRMVANELETSLGGVYSVLARELQYPVAVIVMAQMQKSGDLPMLPKKTVAPQIVTGIAGLGRNSDLSKLQQFVALITQTFPNDAAKYLHVGSIAKRIGTSLDVDTNGIVRTDQEVAQQAAEEQKNLLAQKAIGPGIQNAGKMMQAAPDQPQQ